MEIIKTVARNGDVAMLPAVQFAAAHAAERDEGGGVESVGELRETIDGGHQFFD